MKRAFIAALALAGAPVFAGCIVGPKISANKEAHLAGSALITAGVTAVTGSPAAGLAFGIGIGLAREYDKASTGGACEWSSMAWDAVGVALGFWGGQVYLSRNQVGFVKAF